VNLPSIGGGISGGGRPATRPGIPGAGLANGALAGGASAAFLNNYPTSGRPNLGRIPSLESIASTLPARPGGGIQFGGGSRPGSAARPGDGSRPAGDRPGVGRPEQPGNRSGDIGRPGQPGERPGNIGRPGRPGDRPNLPGSGGWAQHQPSRFRDREQWQESQNWRQNNRAAILAHWHNTRGGYDEWYGDEWWIINRLQDLYGPNFKYYAEAVWPEVTEWVGSRATEPIYYSYGDNVYYRDGSVYYGEQAVATEEQYAAEAEAIATSIPNIKPTEKDWMPLGVFAMTADGEPTGADPTLFLQLAVSKQGIVSGTLQNTATKSVQSIEGMVDKQSQRTAWGAAGKTRPLMETGIANLTKDTTPALLHFPDGTTQQWLLVRLEKPATTDATQR
jgi:hypothetical protein